MDWVSDTPLPHNQLSQRYRGALKMLGIMPMGRRPGTQNAAAAIFYSLPASQYKTFEAEGLGAWQDEVATLWPDFAPFARQITHESQLTMARYAHGTLARVWAQGLVHIGDAAHQASPQLGQGANMALLDAFALARALRRRQDDAALADYAFMRRWHVRLYQAFSYAFTPQYQSHSRALPLLRNSVLAPLSLVPPLPRILSRLVCGDIIPPLASSAALPALEKAKAKS
ncbi:MAG: FAD-dependent monooxygenase [Paracoccaceae bacterium]